MAIYTRTGDKGETALFNGKRVLKSDLRIEVLGSIDELNSAIGVVLSEISNKRQEIRRELIKIQNDLLNIGSNLACLKNRKLASQGLSLQSLSLESLKKRVQDFETLIDEMTESLPLLKNFILPGGGRTGASLHFARAVCRRLERRLVELVKNQKEGFNLIAYFNRLSDLLFTMARFVNFKEKKKEVKWSSKK